MLIDARTVPSGSRRECDVCIVGGGPAGITVALRLLGRGLRVCLLEGGGRSPDRRQQELYRGEVAGHPYYALDTCRFGMYGGSTNRWGGWCRPLEPEDFERRAWIPRSGWPIGAADLEPHHEEVARLLRLPFLRLSAADWGSALPDPLPIQGGALRNTLFQYCEETNFAEEHGGRLEHSDDIEVLLHANVVGLRLGTGPEAGRVDRIDVDTFDGGSFSVRARAVVLAAGGIENPRLLLAARRDRPAGLGNEHDLVGRCFMEHLHVPAGHLFLDSEALDRGFYRKALRGGARVRGVLASRPEAQAAHGLLGTSIALEGRRYHYGTPFLGWRPELTVPPTRVYLRVRRTGARRVGEKVKGTAERAWNTRRTWQTGRATRRARRSGPRRAAVRSLYFRSEQVPDPDSRVTLGSTCDRLGRPVARLDWRISRADTDSVERWLELLAGDVTASGVGAVARPPDDWQRRIIGGPHHMGTTRMAADPADGVVDADCRVHSVENLYVAGSSVFATGGFANPTFTLLALAVRLGDHLLRTCR